MALSEHCRCVYNAHTEFISEGNSRRGLFDLGSCRYTYKRKANENVSEE